MVPTPQFNGKQEGEAVNVEPNLRCPRNGKWTNLQIQLSSQPLGVITRAWEGLARRSISPDTGQQGGCTFSCSLDANALAGNPGRAFMGFYFMQTGIDQTHLAVLGCALPAAFLPLDGRLVLLCREER